MIHPTAIVETDCIGEGTEIGPFCYISKDVVIGKNCKLYGSCSIGTPAQFKEKKKAAGKVLIGNNVEIREYVVINLPTKVCTTISDNCLLMCHTHVGHDSFLHNDVTLVTGACLAGHTTIGKYSVVGLNASTHQYSNIGEFCMIGANTLFKGTSPSGIIWVGVPAKPLKLNKVGLDRYATEKETKTITQTALEYLESYL